MSGLAAWPEATSMAAQIGTGETLPHNGNFARNNWNGNWDRHHHFHNRFFVGAPFFYGGYYAYNGYGNCAWLRRQAIITGSVLVGALSGLPVLLGSLDEFTLPGRLQH